jgi:AraC family transcriptional activator of pobA
MENKRVIDKKSYVAEFSQKELTQFRVGFVNAGNCTIKTYSRRDFYKITLVLGGGSQLLYANRGIHNDRPALVFSNPLVPYSWESVGDQQVMYFCLFSELFLQSGGRQESLQESPLFKAGGEPVYFLNEDQVTYLTVLFKQMCEELDTEYIYKHEILRNQVNLVIHEAIKMQPAVTYFTSPNAASRISKLFLHMLDAQFPVEVAVEVPVLKKAGYYAEKLAVHVNYLNAALREVTGKSTSQHINEQVISAAKSLLEQSDWNISEIAFNLGFDSPSYFNLFFKKHSGMTPLSWKKSI